MSWPALDELLDDLPNLTAATSGITRAASTDATVLILGEAGSGRSALARAVHASSPRRDAPLVEVDPSATPVALFEGELFGWKRGAFSGAESAHEGRVARAQGGALLFDPVEALPLEIQPKLLRLLAERSWTPLGGRESSADLRFLAVGEQDLPQRVEAGFFRADLFYRLDVLSFVVPPLRARRDDLPVLVNRIGADLAARLGRPWTYLTRPTWHWMETYSWPGNLRELRNTLERALVLQRDVKAGLSPPPPEGATRWPAPKTLEQVEYDEIAKALAHTAGHQGEAARLLGISRKSLWERRRRYGIP